MTKGTPAEQAAVAQIEASLPPVRDNTPPTTTLTSTPAKVWSVRTASFSFNSEAGVTFSCSIDGSAFRVCTSHQPGDPPQYPSLAPGDHTFAVKATDATGNTEPKPMTYSWHVDDSRILFESTRNGNSDIYVMDPVADPSGKNAIDLTNNPAADQDPVWSPDRKRIAFHSDRGGPNKNIWVMNADGSSPTQLTFDKVANDTNPTWSPDSKRIAYESNVTGQREIYVIHADGTGKPARLTSNPNAGPDANFDPAWSPLGDKIAFASTRDGNYEIYVMNADGTGQKRLTNDPAVEFNPAWSPDESSIAFHSDVNTASKQIWVMKADGSNAHRVVSTASEDANPVWAPDGAHLAFQSGPTGGTDIWIVAADGTELTRLTFAAGDDTVPDWR
jgi:TolB protein